MPYSENGKKVLTAETLMRILLTLEPTDVVVVNKVGNLTVHRGTDPDTSYVGFIDFAEGVLWLFEGGAHAFDVALGPDT